MTQLRSFHVHLFHSPPLTIPILIIGRFAPSPTGPLHLGSLLAAVGSYLFAKKSGGRWIVRMEDLDRPRVVKGADEEILAALARYSLLSDEPVVYQSKRTALYDEALEKLLALGRAYWCSCSRAELQRVPSAPAAGDAVDEVRVYPGTCRLGLAAGREPRAIRFRVLRGEVEFHDLVHGTIREDVAARTGDFVIRRADGLFAYQLAVVVDDAAQAINQIVRGGDLLDSTPRQMTLQHALSVPTPQYAHLPLIIDRDGAKLGKRTGALPLPTLTDEAVLSTLRTVLRTLGLPDAPGETATEILAAAVLAFDPSRVPRGSVVL